LKGINVYLKLRQILTNCTFKMLCNLLFYQQFRRTYFFLPAASPGILQSYRWKISSPYNFSLHFSYYEWNWEFFAWLDVIYILFKVFFFLQYWDLNSEPTPCQSTRATPPTPFVYVWWVFSREVLPIYLPGLISNSDHPDLCLQSS
jgi:hypothetical protein